MKVSEANGYNPEYPEGFSWNLVDSILADNVSNDIRNHIIHDLKTVERNLVPGLRKALNILASHTDL